MFDDDQSGRQWMFLSWVVSDDKSDGRNDPYNVKAWSYRGSANRGAFIRLVLEEVDPLSDRQRESVVETIAAIDKSHDSVSADLDGKKFV